LQPGRPNVSSSALPPSRITRGYPKRYFGENKISPSLIRLSLLPTAHPRTFQRSRVRSSVSFYGHFNLAMGRSLGFVSIARDRFALLRLGFPVAPPLRGLARAANDNSPVHYAKGTPSPVLPSLRTGHRAPTTCMQAVSGAFNSLNKGAFHLSVALLVNYRS
jgi:hypothetical protein